MERRITYNLILIGVIASVIAMLSTAFAFQKRIERKIQETLAVNSEMMCNIYTFVRNYEELNNYVPQGYHIQVIDSNNGQLLYDNWLATAETDTEDKYKEYQELLESYDPVETLQRPEVVHALSFGEGSARTHRLSSMLDEYYYAIRLTPQKILLVRTAESSLLAWYVSMLPTLFINLAIILIGSYLLSVIATKRMVAPINRLSQRINNETLDFDGDMVYPELVPFVSEIYMQRLRNSRRISELAEEKNKLTAIMKDMSEGIIVFDRSRKIILANDMAQTFFSLRPEDLDTPHYLTNHPTLKSCVDTAMRGCSKMIVTEIGGRQLQITADPIYSDQTQTAVVCSVRDITEQMAIDKIQQEFSANVSHELKTPLSSISGYAEMIEAGIAQPQDITKFAKIIRKESGRLLSLINDIIKLSKLDESAQIETEPVDLLELAEETVDVLTLNAQKKKVQLLIDGESSVVIGARELLLELIYNLTDNAIKYNRENGSVTLHIHGRTLQVADTGIGIPDSAKPHIFDRFFRVEKSRSKEMGGTGLGLAIVWHIVELHNAKIFVEDNPGGGAQFTVIFPPNK